MPRLPHVRVKFEPRDLWIGAYCDYADGMNDTLHRLYVCLVPMLPIVVSWWKRGCAPRRITTLRCRVLGHRLERYAADFGHGDVREVLRCVRCSFEDWPT